MEIFDLLPALALCWIALMSCANDLDWRSASHKSLHIVLIPSLTLDLLPLGVLLIMRAARFFSQDAWSD